MRWNEITEAANPNPKKFWLVLRIGSDHDEETAPQLANGTLTGLKGISASREIVGDFLHTSGNACLVMNPEKVLSDNDLEMIDYHDPEYLLSRNMKTMHRLFNKKMDKYGTQQVLQNIFGEFAKYIRDLKHPEYHTYDYYGFPSKLSYAHNGETIRSVDALVSFFEKAFNEVKNKERLYDMDISSDIIKSGLIYSVLRTAQWYESESEWIVNSETFNVPFGSILLIIKPDFVEQYYDAWKSGEFDASWNPNRWRLISFDYIMDQIKKYDLDQKYKIRFISEEKFASVIPTTKNRRREKKSS